LRIRDLQILSGAMAGISILLIVASIYLWNTPYPDAAQRKIMGWKPVEDFLPLQFAGSRSAPALADAVSRPLFRHSRKPFDQAQATNPPVALEPAQVVPPPVVIPPPDISQITIKGIIIDGSSKRALIVTPEAPDGIWLAVGSEVMGWKIVGLDANGVRISAGDHINELKLYVDNKPI
jgi:hypothetical protein